MGSVKHLKLQHHLCLSLDFTFSALTAAYNVLRILIEKCKEMGRKRISHPVTLADSLPLVGSKVFRMSLFCFFKKENNREWLSDILV